MAHSPPSPRVRPGAQPSRQRRCGPRIVLLALPFRASCRGRPIAAVAALCRARDATRYHLAALLATRRRLAALLATRRRLVALLATRRRLAAPLSTRRRLAALLAALLAEPLATRRRLAARLGRAVLPLPPLLLLALLLPQRLRADRHEGAR